MNKLIIIGNGFDLAHGLPTSYKDFMNWYFEQWRERLKDCCKSTERDELCSLTLNQMSTPWCWYPFSNSEIIACNGLEFFYHLDNDNVKKEISPFLRKILDSIETKGWVDIENDYYELLCSYAKERKTEEVKILNRHLSFLKGKLVEYLQGINKGLMIRKEEPLCKDVKKEIFRPIKENEIAEEFKQYFKKKQDNNRVEKLEVEGIMLLDFNYTTTTSLYCDDKDIIHVHGELNNVNSVIFGYGDEMDDRLKDIMRLNDNEYLTNIKSVRYCENNSYKRMLAFMESGYFQVCIMGHSCGMSDRTLLNTIFEHKKCVSIKPHYRIDKNNNENYSDIIRNIYRNFNNPSLMRDRVVSKEYSNLFG